MGLSRHLSASTCVCVCVLVCVQNVVWRLYLRGSQRVQVSTGRVCALFRRIQTGGDARDNSSVTRWDDALFSPIHRMMLRVHGFIFSSSAQILEMNLNNMQRYYLGNCQYCNKICLLIVCVSIATQSGFWGARVCCADETERRTSCQEIGFASDVDTYSVVTFEV